MGKVVKFFAFIFGLIILFVIGVSILDSPVSKSAKYSNHSYKYSKTRLNVRSGPGTDHNIRKILEPNDKVIIYDSMINGFVIVLKEDSTFYGWTSFEYLQDLPIKRTATRNVKHSSLPKYIVHKEDIIDSPLKVQLSIDLVIEGNDFDEQIVRDLLNVLYSKSIKRTGFDHHNTPTNIYIYVYSSKAKAESGMGQWVGMISKNYSDENPLISISDVQLKSKFENKHEKWSLSYNERQKIWTDLIISQDKAQKMSDIKFPIDGAGVTRKDIEANIDYAREVEEKYFSDILREYNISKIVADSIKLEGISNGWVFPKY